jgi:hypothetical protein
MIDFKMQPVITVLCPISLLKFKDAKFAKKRRGRKGCGFRVNEKPGVMLSGVEA